jgi:hypothetical protein
VRPLNCGVRRRIETRGIAMVGLWAPGDALRIGFIVGLIFGAVDLVFTWLSPLQDDTIGALLLFYGPMFVAWAFASFRAAQQQGRFLPGVATGAIVAFATFCAFILLNLARVNLFLDELTARADWQSMMVRFRASEFVSLRMFVTLDYLKDVPSKLGPHVSSVY